MTDQPLTARSPDYNRGWADGNAAALDACNPIIERLQAELAAAHPPATVPDEGLAEVIRRAMVDSGRTVDYGLIADITTALAALSKPETGQELDAGRLDAALGRMDESDFWYEDDRRNTAGEPLDPELYVRYEALRALLSTTDDEVGES